MSSNRAQSLQVVDPLLTNFARRYQPHGFVYDQIVANVPVSTFTGKYVVYTDQYWFQDEVDDLIEDRGPTNEIDYEWSTDSYDCVKRGFKVSITDEEREQAGALGAFDLAKDKQEFLTHRRMLARERRLAALLLPTGDGGQIGASRTSTPSNNWNVDAATIESDIKDGVLDVYDTIGQEPTHIVIPFKVAYAVALQADIREVFKYTVNGRETLAVGDKVLPAVIHGMKVVIPKGAQQDSAHEGGTASKSEIWGDHVRLLVVDENAGRLRPSVIKRFLHTKPTVKRWRKDDPDIEYIREYDRSDEKVVAPDAAHVIKSVLS